MWGVIIIVPYGPEARVLYWMWIMKVNPGCQDLWDSQWKHCIKRNRQDDCLYIYCDVQGSPCLSKKGESNVRLFNSAGWRLPCRSGPPVDGPKDPWPCVLSLPERFVGDPASLARDNMMRYYLFSVYMIGWWNSSSYCIRFSWADNENTYWHPELRTYDIVRPAISPIA